MPFSAGVRGHQGACPQARARTVRRADQDVRPQAKACRCGRAGLSADVRGWPGACTPRCASQQGARVQMCGASRGAVRGQGRAGRRCSDRRGSRGGEAAREGGGGSAGVQPHPIRQMSWAAAAPASGSPGPGPGPAPARGPRRRGAQPLPGVCPPPAWWEAARRGGG